MDYAAAQRRHDHANKKDAAARAMLAALENILAAAADMTAFLINCDPAKMGEGAWREEHQVLSVRQENSFRDAHAAIAQAEAAYRHELPISPSTD